CNREVEKLAGWGRQLESDVAAKDARILELQREVEEKTGWALRLDAENAAAARRISELQREVEACRHQGAPLPGGSRD
ncbi:MAG: hypothetical protein ACREVG_08180, partial [Burkholderiales bacterium]